MTEFIAKRDIKAIAPDGRQFTITAHIGRPYKITDDEWACPIALDGLYGPLADQHGIDSWQALKLACALATGLLSSFLEKGDKLFLWSDHGALTPEEFREFKSYMSADPNERKDAELYLLGVMDATEGKDWCDYRTFKTVTLRERIFEEFKKLDSRRLDERASPRLSKGF